MLCEFPGRLPRMFLAKSPFLVVLKREKELELGEQPLGFSVFYFTKTEEY